MKRALRILVVLFALLAAFLLLSFRVMASQTARAGNLAASDPTFSDGTAVQPPSVTALRVEGGSRLAQSVQKALAGALQKQPALGSFQPAGGDAGASGDAEASGSAVLNVTLNEQKVFWSPVHAHAQLVVEVAYASNGDLLFRQADGAHFRSSRDRPAVQFLGRYAVADIS